jgi:acyl carrier protein
VEGLISRAFGRCEEELFASGVLDSLRAVELGVLLEQEFGLSLTDLSLQDLASVTNIVDKVSTNESVRQAR